ncbi:MAG TPA: hypothetical protein VHG72_10115 [Polyangia bacterium]|nr:hypothetical protein [Polyangia bacterium]
MGVLGLDLRKPGRVALMDQIGATLAIPSGGWHGQARLFAGPDLRLRWLLQRLSNEHGAKLVADNLARTGRYVDVNPMLATVSAARESDRSLTATGTAMVDTFNEGGLDYLWQQKNKLGLPGAIIRTWQQGRSGVSVESHHTVYPARIPANDQLLAYAAQIAASFRLNFHASLRREFGREAEAALANASRKALLVWQAYTFLAPGGGPYDPNRPLREQLGMSFGHRSALSLYAHNARQQGRKPSLDDIVTDRTLLVSLEWFHSAKTRAAEALFMERLLKRARELLAH